MTLRSGRNNVGCVDDAPTKALVRRGLRTNGRKVKMDPRLRGDDKARRLEPIALEIHWKRLVSMVDEAATAFIRTSFSVLVREANDFAVVLTDAQGRSLAQSTMSIASFIGSLPATVKHFLDVFPAKTLKPVTS